MGKGRWIYDNFITDAGMITLSSAQAGQVGRVVPQALGGALLMVQGQYTGDDDCKYEVKIDSVESGTAIGQATFCWRASGDEAWRGQKLATSSILRELEHGVCVKWSSSEGEDFVKGDRWTFLAMRLRGRSSLAADDPDRQWRSQGCAQESITVDMATPRQVQALVLGHHNLSAQASVSIMAHHQDQWSAPAFTLVPNLTSPHLVCFPGVSYRYWRLELSDPGNPDGYLRAAQLFLGRYLEPAVNFIYGSERSTIYNRSEITSAGNLLGASQAGRAEILRLAYRNLGVTDVQELRGLLDAVHGGSGGRVRPVWLCPDMDDQGDLVFGLPASELRRRLARPGPQGYEVTLSFSEIARRVM
jgi:hypothetical protein